MSAQTKRLGLFATALAIGSISLVACAANPITPANSNSNVAFITPDTAQFTPTPQFPVFTIGAWPSNPSPSTVDTITIYIICRVQDPTMKTPSLPPPKPVTVRVSIGPPINTGLQGTTDADGMAALAFSVNDSNAGQPVDVYVTANWNGQLYTARTYFTPSPGALPTATPQPTVVTGGSPTATATP